MDGQEILQSIIGKTIKSIEPFVINDEILSIEITFTNNTVLDIQSHCNSNSREGFLSFRNIVQKES